MLFKESKLLALLARLSNENSEFYKDVRECLDTEYMSRIPSTPLYVDNASSELFRKIIEEKNNLDAIREIYLAENLTSASKWYNILLFWRRT